MMALSCLATLDFIYVPFMAMRADPKDPKCFRSSTLMICACSFPGFAIGLHGLVFGNSVLVRLAVEDVLVHGR
jgi:hypothetical protein